MLIVEYQLDLLNVFSNFEVRFMRTVLLPTDDGFVLHGHVFEPRTPNGKILVINAATGVKQQVYFSFAKFFAEQGVTVITYDYRGIGLSKPRNLKGFKASMRMWGRLDFKAVTDFILKNYADYQKFCLGHSVGALIIGMNPQAQIFEKFIFVATQNAYFGNLPAKVAATALIGFGLAVPVTSGMLGYFPAHWFGLGETLPKGSAMDWRTLILRKKSTSKLYEKIDQDFSKNLHQKTLVIYAEDDPWVKTKGMESLMNNVFPNLQTSYRLIRTVESPKKEIGHINFFRSYNSILWNIVLHEL